MNKPTYQDLEQRVAELEAEIADLKQVIHVRQYSEDIYRAFFENSIDALFITTPEGRVMEANPAACSMFGYSQEELIRLGRSAVVDLEDCGLRDALQERARTGKYKGELIFKRKDGTRVPVEVTSAVFKDDDSVRTSMIVRDLTNLKRAEEDLRESENRFSSAFKYAAIGMAIVSPEGRLLKVNRALCDLLGYSEEELLARDYQCVTHPEDLARDMAYVEQMLAGTIQTYNMEKRYIHKEGHTIWALLSVSLIRDPYHTPKYFISQVIDITARKSAEEMLRSQEQFLRTVVQTTAVGFWVVSSDGIITDVNKAYCALSGYAREEILGLHVNDIDVDETLDQTRERIHRIIASGSEFFETRHRRKDGSVFPVEMSATYLDVDGGKFVCFGRDLSERKRAEEALRESEEKYRSLTKDVLDSSEVGICILDSGFRVVWVNHALERFFGLRRDDVVGRDKRQLVRERIAEIFEGSEAFAAKVFAAYDNNTYTEKFECHVLPGGRREERWLQHWSQPIQSGLYAGGRIEHYYDITGRKQAEDALRASEKTFRQLAENTEAILWEYHIPSDKWTYVAPQSKRILGYVPEDWTDLRFWIDRLHPDDRDWASKYSADLTARGESHEYEYRFMTKDGKPRWVRDVVSVEMRDGKPVTKRGFLIDIDARRHAEEERKRLQEQLYQAQKMESVGRLAGGVAHDFNNMLGVILGYTEIAMSKVNPDDPVHDDLKQIFKAAQHSADVTRQLLAFARRQTINPRILNLNDTVEGMLRMLRRLIGEDIDLSWHPGTGSWLVEMDSSQLDQILANLCVNARDAISNVGKITIETDVRTFDEVYCADHANCTPGEYVLLAVSDDGRGMDRETLEHLFEPFFTTKEVGEGTGLG
ncbi:MAG: PAS domain S-box protein, partial [Syntrophobacteraceae bacterium]|nr:PAS domain S-box protein [Syntrophobacteraceae bacterium]